MCPTREGEVDEVVADHHHRQKPEQGAAFEVGEHEDDSGAVPEHLHAQGQEQLEEEEGGDLGEEGLDVDGLGVLEEVQVEVGVLSDVSHRVVLAEGSGVEGDGLGEILLVGDEPKVGLTFSLLISWRVRRKVLMPSL